MHTTFNQNFMHALVDQANLKPEPRPVEMFKDFLPAMYKEEFEKDMPRINPATLPQKLKDTHAMTCKIKDPRRREPYGLDGVTCTNLRATSQGLPNGKDIHKSVLKLRRREDEEAEEEEELQKENPEDPDEQKLCEKLQQKLAARGGG